MSLYKDWEALLRRDLDACTDPEKRARLEEELRKCLEVQAEERRGLDKLEREGAAVLHAFADLMGVRVSREGANAIAHLLRGTYDRRVQ